ncbi:DICT sensory domain-containing protein [Leptolyngbya sp. FACHB-711]|uniref:DICT sensory domain-containing protein n=1 Tax=unclassified Leptolyngbya TaxID=2650499 RepID=UPI001685E4BD|nr:DICT sensory domain-containing protein [Leptolyngbya sp. FACHB-711]MBD1850830.1 metal-dependent phosphohydrolase [Cyanobacteria bacterium FACHB-502]MBD2027670.1 metal-dependent phosphohydrolase [Leptolyngbya sp. FACHB-711]
MLQGSILQKLGDAHRSSFPEKRPLNFGVYYKNTLVALCHALEDAILSADYQPLMITAFQRGKWYLQEADRYGDIADRSRQVVILAGADAGFTDHPTSHKANVDLVTLDPTDAVAQEWHLIIVSPNYTAMVLCQELSDEDYGTAGRPQADLERKFYGLWTFEPSLVQETAALAIDHVGRYNPALQQQLQTHLAELIDRSQHHDALCHTPTADHLGDIVMRVIEYLEESQQTVTTDPQPHALVSNLTSNELQALLRIAQLIDQTDLSNPNAAAEVATLAEAMGQLLDLPAWQLHRLRLAGLLHRIAFLQPIETVLSAQGSGQATHAATPLTSPIIPGVKVLRKMQRLKAISTILTHQTECWNGSGRPSGLAGDEIPVESRILGLIADFQQKSAQARSSGTPDAEAALQAYQSCQQGANEQWDPKLVEALGLLVSAMQQGISLPVALPKIAAGLWLLDSHSSEELLSYGSEPEGSESEETISKTGS